MSDHIITCILGLAESEERKLHLWPQWQRCVPPLDDVLGPLASAAVIRCVLAFEAPLAPRKSDPPGVRRVTYRPVPMGRLRWNPADNRRWSERPLLESEYPVRHISTTIASAQSAGRPPDVFVQLMNRDTCEGAAYNQILVLAISESRWLERSAAEWDAAVEDLGAVARAARIGRARRPWMMERARGDHTEMSVIADHAFETRFDSLRLDDRWQTWSYLR